MFLMGDVNAKVGSNHESQVSRKCALGKQDERGEVFIDFAERHDFMIWGKYWERQHEEENDRN